MREPYLIILGDLPDVLECQSAAGVRCSAMFVVSDYTAAGVVCLGECGRYRGSR